MPVGGGPTRRFILAMLAMTILVIIFITSFRSHALPHELLNKAPAPLAPPAQQQHINELLGSDPLSGPVIAPKLDNETIKAELGRASWKLFHTVMARFPDKPTADESAALKSYIHLFQRLYPCGECAEHFGEILEDYPPQVSSRSAAAAWACHVHNEVNISLKKDRFDCANIGDWYDCGCADDEKEVMNKEGEKKAAET